MSDIQHAPFFHGNRIVVEGLSCALMDITAAEQAYMLSIWGHTVPLINHETGMVIPVDLMAGLLRSRRSVKHKPLLEALEYAKSKGADYAVTKVVEKLR